MEIPKLESVEIIKEEIIPVIEPEKKEVPKKILKPKARLLNDIVEYLNNYFNFNLDLKSDVVKDLKVIININV